MSVPADIASILLQLVAKVNVLSNRLDAVPGPVQSETQSPGASQVLSTPSSATLSSPAAASSYVPGTLGLANLGGQGQAQRYEPYNAPPPARSGPPGQHLSTARLQNPYGNTNWVASEVQNGTLARSKGPLYPKASSVRQRASATPAEPKAPSPRDILHFGQRSQVVFIPHPPIVEESMTLDEENEQFLFDTAQRWGYVKWPTVLKNDSASEIKAKIQAAFQPTIKLDTHRGWAWAAVAESGTYLYKLGSSDALDGPTLYQMFGRKNGPLRAYIYSTDGFVHPRFLNEWKKACLEQPVAVDEDAWEHPDWESAEKRDKGLADIMRAYGPQETEPDLGEQQVAEPEEANVPAAKSARVGVRQSARLRTVSESLSDTPEALVAPPAKRRQTSRRQTKELTPLPPLSHAPQTTQTALNAARDAAAAAAEQRMLDMVNYDGGE